MDVLYIGDHKLQANQYFVGADSFQVFHKEVRDHEPLLETLGEAENVDVDYLDGPATMIEFPRSLEGLTEYDVLIVSDLSRGTLKPHFDPDTIRDQICSESSESTLRTVEDWCTVVVG